MHASRHYREQAERARRLASHTTDRGAYDTLTQLAADFDFDEIAEDLERGAIEIRHPELMPQRHGH